MRHVQDVLFQNKVVASGKSFLGAGTYNHFVPAVVDEVINRSEFLTAYAESHTKTTDGSRPCSSTSR